MTVVIYYKTETQLQVFLIKLVIIIFLKKLKMSALVFVCRKVPIAEFASS